ncbi:MAG: FGGY family carbohydrate kinase, partial [Actinomycetota bacterium]|nr:FGGY family carbohydrate kinase [Actinomycetota bacterium]
MSRPALLGIDLGTSGVKVLVASADDTRPLAEATAGYDVTRARRGWAETDPGQWWAATVNAVRRALADAGGVDILGVGVDGQMHGLVLSDSAGRPVRPALLWADQRAVEELPRWHRLPAETRRDLANPITPGMTGPLWAWVAEHEPAALARARWALLPKDWLRLRLTGTAAAEPSDASATLLWNVPGDRWDLDVVSGAGLDPGLLPPVLRSAGAAGEVTPAAAGEMGLAAGI